MLKKTSLLFYSSILAEWSHYSFINNQLFFFNPFFVCFKYINDYYTEASVMLLHVYSPEGCFANVHQTTSGTIKLAT